MQPNVSVIMPVYNGEQYLVDAIDSILSQTFTNFEFIIINDGSTDSSAQIIRKYSSIEHRIRFIDRENRGLVYSLNEAIEVSRGEFIARFDCDDISLPERLEKQVQFLQKNPEIDVVGCDFGLIDAGGKRRGLVCVPKSREDIFLNLVYSVPFAHPSVMVRKSFYKKNRYVQHPAEDYLLWVKGYKSNYANIEGVYLLYRRNYGKSFSDTKRLEMIRSSMIVSRGFVNRHNTTIWDTLHGYRGASLYKCRALAELMFLDEGKNVLSTLVSQPSAIPCVFFYYLRHIARNWYRKIW